MTADPFRRPPMVDFAHPAGESLFWRLSAALDRLVEQLEQHSPADLFFQKVDRDIALAERAAIATTTNTGSAGGAMASIEGVRAGIVAANEKANEGLGAMQHAHVCLEEAQGRLMHATEGSGQADVSTALGLLAQAVNDLDAVRQQVSAAISSSESIANRL